MSSKSFPAPALVVRKIRVALVTLLFVVLLAVSAYSFMSARSADKRADALAAKVSEFPVLLEAARLEASEKGYLDSSWDTYFQKNRYAFDKTPDGGIVAWKLQTLPPDKVPPKTSTVSNVNSVPLLPEASAAATPIVAPDVEPDKKLGKR